MASIARAPRESAAQHNKKGVHTRVARLADARRAPDADPMVQVRQESRSRHLDIGRNWLDSDPHFTGAAEMAN